MGVVKTVNVEGTGKRPEKGDKVTIEYTGWIKDLGAPEGKGEK